MRRATSQQATLGSTLVKKYVPESIRAYIPLWAEENAVLVAAGVMFILGLLLLLLGARHSRGPAPATASPGGALAAVAAGGATSSGGAPQGKSTRRERPDGSTEQPDSDPTSGKPASKPLRSLAEPMPETRIVSAMPAAPEPREVLAWVQFLDAKSTRLPIVTASVRIGRHADNDITLENRTVHRHHALLYRSPDGRFTITDLDTLNRVFVNREAVKARELESGDLVELGEVRFRFFLAEGGAG